MPVSRRRRHAWEKLPTRELLDVRLCDLGLELETSPLAPRIEVLHDELERVGLGFRPRIWLSMVIWALRSSSRVCFSGL